MVINSRHILLPKNKKLKKWYWWYKIKKNSIFVISIFKFMHEQFSQADYDVRSISHATMALSGCDIITCQSVLCHRVRHIYRLVCVWLSVPVCYGVSFLGALIFSAHIFPVPIHHVRVLFRKWHKVESYKTFFKREQNPQNLDQHQLWL